MGRPSLAQQTPAPWQSLSCRQTIKWVVPVHAVAATHWLPSERGEAAVPAPRPAQQTFACFCACPCPPLAQSAGSSHCRDAPVHAADRGKQVPETAPAVDTPRQHCWVAV